MRVWIRGQDVRFILFHPDRISCLDVLLVIIPIAFFMVSLTSTFMEAGLACVPDWQAKAARMTHVPFIETLVQ